MPQGSVAVRLAAWRDAEARSRTHDDAGRPRPTRDEVEDLRRAYYDEAFTALGVLAGRRTVTRAADARDERQG